MLLSTTGVVTPITDVANYSKMLTKTAYCVIGSDGIVDAIYFAD